MSRGEGTRETCAAPVEPAEKAVPPAGAAPLEEAGAAAGDAREDALLALYGRCELCPRRCGARRLEGQMGFCGMSAEVKLARAALHFWEEPPISGERGSGAVFLSGCTLRCVFCQNHEISTGGFGAAVSVERLAQAMLELQAQGALNVNLVTPGHFAPSAVAAVRRARAQGLALPIVCNTSGYELESTVELLGEVVDVWLPDFKYASGELAARLSGAPDYPEVAAAALARMVELVDARGGRLVREDGAMERGVIVRHLVLPGHALDSCAVLDRVREVAGDACDLSVMNQYTPNEAMRRAGGPLAGPVPDEDYELVLCHADDLGFENLWWQEGGTVSESFVPAFDLTGVRGA